MQRRALADSSTARVCERQLQLRLSSGSRGCCGQGVQRRMRRILSPHSSCSIEKQCLFIWSTQMNKSACKDTLWYIWLLPEPSVWILKTMTESRHTREGTIFPVDTKRTLHFAAQPQVSSGASGMPRSTTHLARDSGGVEKTWKDTGRRARSA